MPRASLAALAVALVLACGAAGSALGAGTVTQPPQPKTGPGGSAHSHAGMRVTAGGEGADGWYVFEPMGPRPARAPVTVVTHGYYEFSGHRQLDAFIRHTVLRGSIVIYPRWQTGIAEPCPGPYLIGPCIDSEVAGIRGALSYLRADRKDRVQPVTSKASYFGFSFGGIITANMANRWRALGVPKPRVIFLDDPHDGGLTGPDEPALDDDLGGIPASTLIQCHAPAGGVISGTNQQGQSTANGSCNAVMPKLTSIPARNRDLVLTHSDDHGEPGLASVHGVCADGGFLGEPNAYDWNFCWKVWDALRSCAFERRNCRYALGNTPEHRSMGRWSDGTPVKALVIRDRAPIAP